jgi:pimeloyl-ACP methyl ester carboxylesterase
MTVSNPFLPGFRERYTEVRGTRLRWFEAGNGTRVALLHGFGGAAANWALVAPALAERCRVLVPELPGHGGSSALPAPPERLDPYADRMAALLDGPAVLVGHSLGAVVALRLALRHPDLVRGLVLTAPAGIVSGTRRTERALTLVSLVQPGKRISPLSRAFAHNALLRRLAFGLVGVADPRALDPVAAEGFLAGSALHTDVRAAGDALVRTDPRVDLEHVGCPALIVHGARDVQVPLRDGFEYARRLRAPLRVIADCGHLLIGERPRAVVDAIVDFLNRIPESSVPTTARRSQNAPDEFGPVQGAALPRRR